MQIVIGISLYVKFMDSRISFGHESFVEQILVLRSNMEVFGSHGSNQYLHESDTFRFIDFQPSENHLYYKRNIRVSPLVEKTAIL